MWIDCQDQMASPMAVWVCCTNRRGLRTPVRQGEGGRPSTVWCCPPSEQSFAERLSRCGFPSQESLDAQSRRVLGVALVEPGTVLDSTLDARSQDERVWWKYFFQPRRMSFLRVLDAVAFREPVPILAATARENPDAVFQFGRDFCQRTLASTVVRVPDGHPGDLRNIGSAQASQLFLSVSHERA